jgi:hypothetical protein
VHLRRVAYRALDQWSVEDSNFAIQVPVAVVNGRLGPRSADAGAVDKRQNVDALHPLRGPGYRCGPGPCVGYDYGYDYGYGYQYGPRFRANRRPRSEDLEGYLDEQEAELAKVKAGLGALCRGREARA